MSLEDQVKDTKENRGFIKKAGRLLWKAGMAVATTALSVPLVGTLGIAVGGAFAAGSAIAYLARGKSLFETIDDALTTYSAVNAVIAPMIWLSDLTMPLISNATTAGKLLRGLYSITAYNAAFVGSYYGAAHLIDNYMNPTGIVNEVKSKFPRRWMEVGLLFSPFYYLAANNIAGIAFNNVLTPSIASGSIIPQYNNYIAPTFAAGALPAGFALDYWFPKDKKKIGH